MTKIHSQLGLVFLLLLVSLVFCASARAIAPGITVPCSQMGARPCLIGSPTNIWNVGGAANLSVDPDSANMIADLNAEVAKEQGAGTGPWINTNAQILLAPANAPTVSVKILDVPRNYQGLQAVATSVPVPEVGFVTTGDSDQETVVWQQSTNKMWEFWRLGQAADGSWQAHWGGRMPSVTTDPGYYSAANNTDDFGATASGLPLAYGEVSPEWDTGRVGGIGHALALNVPSARKGVYSFPAQRTDGTNADPESLPEGTMLRLDPSYDINQITRDCPACTFTRLLAQAAQDYGVIVRDQTGGSLGFWAQDITPYGHPGYFYVGSPPVPRSSGPFQGQWPTRLMHYFPWSHLQVVQMQCHPTACA
jgi:hypothetical protein